MRGLLDFMVAKIDHYETSRKSNVLGMAKTLGPELEHALQAPVHFLLSQSLFVYVFPSISYRSCLDVRIGDGCWLCGPP